jgi:hypothetical protein
VLKVLKVLKAHEDLRVVRVQQDLPVVKVLKVQ